LALEAQSVLTHRLRKWQRGIFFGWWVLVAVMLLQTLVSALFVQSFGIYVPVLLDEFGWSATGISLAVSARQLLSAIAGPGIGFAIDRFGSRVIIAVGLCLLAVGYLLFSHVNGFLMFIIIQLVLGFAANLTGWLPNTKILVNWFVRRRTMALALMGVGMSVGGLLSPLIAYGIELYGWRSVATASGALMVLGLALLPLLYSSPEDRGLKPESDVRRNQTSVKAQTILEDEFTVQAALRTRSFWLIAAGHGLALTSVVAIVVHYVTHVSTGLGFSLQVAATLFALLTGMQMVGQLFSGFAGDSISKRWLAAGAMLVHALAISLLAFGQTLNVVIAASALHGLAWGTRGPLMSAIRADYFGRRNFGKIMGMSDPIVIGGALVGPVIAGYSFDVYGSYQMGFLWIALLAVIGAGCFAFAAKPKS
jgi:sugar phosphate permease